MGGAGSFGGPLGTIIGIGVGLIVGVIIDWRLSKVFESKIAEQCNRFLDTLEYHLRDGASPNSGLRAALLESTRLTNQAQSQAIRIALRESNELPATTTSPPVILSASEGPAATGRPGATPIPTQLTDAPKNRELP